ncbi:HAMP domain-containing histidine kinase [Luteimonas sp. S4-F44]|uniref:sensor histidine kinase n=1 Tax=Luteimonas sp. S4-F44 TaxID=2925842 RepID=UPI001F536E57|nr:HAMP domain-containing sensor histidine kinase [Luteimonas sp. S4-F44]UNK42473.1 HAMP domain-containing histidine kinase [Luteimonas sp. S4-F44]
MYRPFLRWLDRAPVQDPVDQRNARVIQALLLFLGVTVPATVTFALVASWPMLRAEGLPWQIAVSLSMSLAIGLIALGGVALIRHGRFRLAVKLLIGVLLAVFAVNMALNGLQKQIPDQLAQLLVMLLSGLVLGRRALWTSFALLASSVLLGAVHDAHVLFAQTPARAFYNLPSVLFTYLLVAILIDRTTEALRESLRESNARGAALEQEIRERERTHAQLIHAQKKEITERMASGMAHDFNNIFSVIAGFSAERHEDDGGSDAQRAAQLESSLASVEASARRGMAISRRLLRFSRRDGTQVEVFDAGEAIDALQPMLRQLLDARIVLRFERDAAPLPILFDRSQFELMLLNLASNARDAIDGTGVFEIQARRARGEVAITLRDDGAGMPPEVTARVFEPFFSTKPADSGTGLGLAVVHELVTTAGGKITVTSAPGAGTTFRIALPLSPAA